MKQVKHYVLLIVTAALAVSGVLAYWGSSYATKMVRDELVAQRISFPTKAEMEKDGEPANLVAYAGQKVDNGEKAKAYAEFIQGHMDKIANGKTYSEVSAEYMANKTDQKLAGQRQSLFMGDTLRGLLLNAWGWSFIGELALYVAIALFVAATVVFFDYAIVDKFGSKTTKRSGNVNKL